MVRLPFPVVAADILMRALASKRARTVNMVADPKPAIVKSSEQSEGDRTVGKPSN